MTTYQPTTKEVHDTIDNLINEIRPAFVAAKNLKDLQSLIARANDLKVRLLERSYDALKPELEAFFIDVNKHPVYQAVQDKNEKIKLLADACEKFIEERDIYFVITDNVYSMYNRKTFSWTHSSSEALRTAYPELLGSTDGMEQFKKAMAKLGRNKDKRTVALRKDLDDSYLNEMRTEHWLKPVKGKTSIFFDALLRSLGNNKKENMDHIKQVIGWKYTHPEDYQLPCLCFSGEGGAGKNMLADVVLATVFGAHQTKSVRFKQLEKWGTAIKGTMVINIDEAAQEKVDVNIIKSFVGKEIITIEEKGINFYDIYNLALYMMSTNNEVGAIQLEPNDSTRRWSILRLETTLVASIIDVMNENRQPGDPLIDKNSKADCEAIMEYLRNDITPNVYKSREEVSHFLYDCVEAANALTGTPSALHGEDYESLEALQETALDHVMTEVFVDDQKFTHIIASKLYEIYKERAKVENPGASPLSLKTFYGQVKQRLAAKDKYEYISMTPDRVNIKERSGKRNKHSVYFSTAKFDKRNTIFDDNSDRYESGDYLSHEEQRPVLVSMK